MTKRTKPIMKNYILIVLLCTCYALEEYQQPYQFFEQQKPRDQQQHQLSETGQNYPLLQRQAYYPSQRTSHSYVTNRPQYQDEPKSLDVEQSQVRQLRQQQPQEKRQYGSAVEEQSQYYPKSIPQEIQQYGQVPYHAQATTHQIIISEVRQLVPQYSGTTIVSMPTNMVGEKVTQVQQHVKEHNNSQLEDSNSLQNRDRTSAAVDNSKSVTISDSKVEHVTDQYTKTQQRDVVTGVPPQRVAEFVQQHEPVQEQNTKNTRNRREVVASVSSTSSTQPPSISSNVHSMAQSRQPHLVQQQEPKYISQDERRSRAFNSAHYTRVTQSPSRSRLYKEAHQNVEVTAKTPQVVASTNVPTTSTSVTTTSMATSDQQVTKLARSIGFRGRQYQEMTRSQRQVQGQGQNTNITTLNPLQQTTNRQNSTTKQVVTPVTAQSTVSEVQPVVKPSPPSS